MIEFDANEHMAMIILSLEGVSVNLNLDLRKIKNEELLWYSRLDQLNSQQLKSLLKELDSRFKLDEKSPLPWKEQFCRALIKACDNYLSVPKTLSESQKVALSTELNGYHKSLVAAAGIKPSEYKEALTCEYNPGTNNLVMDDDFLVIRKGRKTMALIALEGNDYNNLKCYLKQGGERMLTPDNVKGLRESLRSLKTSQALEHVKELSHHHHRKVVVGMELKIGKS